MNIQPIVLEGNVVRLEPLAVEHHAMLCEVGLDPGLWKFTTTNIQTADDMKSYMGVALNEQHAGSALPFVIVERVSGAIVGSTRYCNIEKQHRKLEIGYTWVAKRWQRTAINTEAKYLLLTHAFEKLGCLRVELKTDALNEKSRAAIIRIGAKQEGILRKHMITQSGRERDSVYFSFINTEWAELKTRLEEMLRI